MTFLAVIISGLQTTSLFAVDMKIAKKRVELLAEAQKLMEEREISYVYGGNKVGDTNDCKECNSCLGKFMPKPKERVKKCPVCLKCSVDCSHFTQLSYKNAGFYLPYLETKMMISLSKRKLRKLYHLVDIGTDVMQALPGDLLVYRGHVVLLEVLHRDGSGDIIHATGGKEIRIPGQGIQRKRRAHIRNFHGRVLRILRHKDLIPVRKLRAVK